MTSRTAFLGRLVGLYSILVPLSLITHKASSVATVHTLIHNPPVLLILGIITLAVGLAIVLGHNVWSGGFLPIVVTLVGWITLIKGLVFLFLSPEAVSSVLTALQYEQRYYVYAAVSIVAGFYLTYSGFRPAPR